MYHQKKQLAVLAVLSVVTSAFDLPDNLRAIYQQNLSKSCTNPLSSIFSEGDVYCADIPNAIFLQSGPGTFADMAIDCDGLNNAAGNCANDPSGQSQTAFKETVRSYGIEDLDANLHSYVVFGNEGGSPEFSPAGAGMVPLSVMAIVCNNQVHYGVWGDTNGFTSTGEASLALAKICFPDEGLNGNSGHDGKDVLYIGFKGTGAVPGADGADWHASSPEAFEESLRVLGDALVAGL